MTDYGRPARDEPGYRSTPARDDDATTIHANADAGSSYTPPADVRPAWAQQSQWDDSQPGHWFDTSPRGVSYVRTQQVEPTARRSRGAGLLLVPLLLVSLISAGLASAGTYFALQASGRLDLPPAASSDGGGRSATLTTSGGGTTQPIRIDDQSAVTEADAATSSAVVTINSGEGTTTILF